MAPTLKQQEAMSLYAAILEEAKIRLAAIEDTLANPRIIGPLKREYGFLQLRMLCELIALCCLTAHGDIKKNAANLRKEYAADKIMGHLEKLHPDYFPKPVEQVATDYGYEMSPSKAACLTKAELLTLYGKSGGVLHRGGIKNLLSPRTPIQTNLPDVVGWGQKINNLLRLHIHFLFDGKTTLLCVLRNSKDGGRSQVAIAEASGPPPGFETSPSA